MSLVKSKVQSIDQTTSPKRKLTNRVLLLGNDDRVVLAVARSLGRKGIAVHLAWHDPSMSATRSRYVSRLHWIPAYCHQSDKWSVALNELVRAQDFDLVIPCNDFAVVPLQTEREKLDANTNWYLIDHDAFLVAFDKKLTSQHAKELGISLPVEFTLTSDEVESLAYESQIDQINNHQLQFPVYVKPPSSITQNDVHNKRAAQKIETPIQLAAVIAQGSDPDGLLIQESFEGDGVGVEVLARDGHVLIELQHRRLRETIDGGSTYRETVKRNSELTEATAKLVRRLNYTGVGMFEYRLNPQTRKWVFLEINARFWGSLPLAVASGGDFPFALYEMLVLERQTFPSQYKTGVRCRNLIADLRAFRKQRSLPNQKQGFQWVRLCLGKDHLDRFSADDWVPQFHALMALGQSIIRKMFRQASC